MIPIAGEHQRAGDQVVREHLPVVFPPLFDVDDKDLLEPECKLYKIIPLHRALQLPAGPAGPELTQIEPMFMGIHYVLCLVSIPSTLNERAIIMYHAQRPDGCIIDHDPALFCKTDAVFSLRNAHGLGQRYEYVVHSATSEPCENNDAVEYHVKVVPAHGVFPGFGIVVREGMELPGTMSGSGEEHVGQCVKQQQVDRQAWSDFV